MEIRVHHSVPECRRFEQEQHSADTAEVVEEAQWALYERVMDAAAREDIPFAIGGAFGLAIYTGVARNTKDLDIYVLPGDRERAIDVVSRLGLRITLTRFRTSATGFTAPL